MQNEFESVETRKYILHRRFDRMGRLLGDTKMAALFKSHVMIIGIGGVGSWAAESLARSGVGTITLVDFDDICITNTNRQLHAHKTSIGKKKVHVMAERLQTINPQAKVQAIEEFYSESTSQQILSLAPNLILDCIDNIKAKCHLLNSIYTWTSKFPHHTQPILLSAGGAGSRLDPLQIEVTDLSATHTDPFLQQVRKTLRTQYDWPNDSKFGIDCIFSKEVPHEPESLSYDADSGFKCVCPQGQNNFHSCERRNVIHGTASFVTGTFGLVMASSAVGALTKQAPQLASPQS